MKNHCFYPDSFFYYTLIILFFSVFLISPSIAQPHELDEADSLQYANFNTAYGFNLAGVYTGSALGLNINPSAFYKFRKNLIAFGPNIQQDRFNVSGVQGYFQHDLASSLRKTILYYHINLIYHISANLINGQIVNGQPIAQKQNAFENYLGFGLRKGLSERLYFDSNLGVGMYYTLNDTYINQLPFRSDNDFSLLIKIGLTYDFRK